MHYAVLLVEIAVGFVMLPLNTSYLGQSAYGLWVLVGSITAYFSMLDLGYGTAVVKFVAHYRAHRNTSALNEIVSTIFFVFAAIGLLSYGAAVMLALNLQRLFSITPGEAVIGEQLLLITGAYVAMGFPFSVFGGIVNGLQRNYLNGRVAIFTVIAVALANVAVVLMGYGLVVLVAVTTAVRALSYFAYRLNAYRVFPELRISIAHVNLARLREVTGFSIFMVLIDLANKLNYSTDTLVIGVFLGPAAVAVWAVAARLIQIIQQMTGRLNAALLPVVVDGAALGHIERLRSVLLQGTRLSLAMVIGLACGAALVAEPLIVGWVGPEFTASAAVLQILAAVVIVRVGNGTATTLLKGAGRHRLLAYSNLGMAILNLALSAALVQQFGLKGVAVGTLLPLALVSLLFLFPAACRVVELHVRVAFRHGVWPAVWPALLIAVLIAGMRHAVRIEPILEAVLATALYPAIFLALAITPNERVWYLEKSKELFKSAVAPASV